MADKTIKRGAGSPDQKLELTKDLADKMIDFHIIECSGGLIKFPKGTPVEEDVPPIRTQDQVFAVGGGETMDFGGVPVEVTGDMRLAVAIQFDYWYKAANFGYKLFDGSDRPAASVCFDEWLKLALKRAKRLLGKEGDDDTFKKVDTLYVRWMATWGDINTRFEYQQAVGAVESVIIDYEKYLAMDERARFRFIEEDVLIETEAYDEARKEALAREVDHALQYAAEKVVREGEVKADEDLRASSPGGSESSDT